ncbi:MAG: prenyltransferase [Phycisphaerae bacterium]|nr:prenyltransferase [Phycisphaerae bacterium]
MKHARFLIPIALGATLLHAQPAIDPGNSAQNNPLDQEITPQLDAAVKAGISYLATTQEADGSWASGRYGKNVAITALACLALMSDGHMPGRGELGDVVDRGVEFMLSSSNDSGLITSEANNGPMYGHGFATLFLGEVYGMTPGGDNARANRIHEALVKAVRLIEQTQNDEGGWRYNPVPYDADVSVTICQIMALRSARNAGIEVSSEVIDRAVEYVRMCQNADGGFKYQLGSGNSAWPRTAAGVASLYYAGIYEDDAIDKGIEYLTKNALPGKASASRSHYFYGQYYAVQAMYLAGDAHWALWWPAIRAELIAQQNDEGSWDDRSVGKPYGTAMALIVLQMPKRYLPIFQK